LAHIHQPTHLLYLYNIIPISPFGDCRVFSPTFFIVSLLPDTPDVVTERIAIKQSVIVGINLGIRPGKTISELPWMDAKIGFSLWVSSVSLSKALRFVFGGGKMLYIMVKKRKSNSARFAQKIL